jgi:benzoyl-CoA reductase/2-hydroxyglutaryl-CoA dehydratase subunit BcrC/BadD/HgdB
MGSIVPGKEKKNKTKRQQQQQQQQENIYTLKSHPPQPTERFDYILYIQTFTPSAA